MDLLWTSSKNCAIILCKTTVPRKHVEFGAVCCQAEKQTAHFADKIRHKILFIFIKNAICIRGVKDVKS